MKQNKFILLLLLMYVALGLSSCGENNSSESSETEESEFSGPEAVINMTLSTSSEEAKSSFVQGLHQFYMGNATETRKLFDKVSEADPEFALVYSFRAYRAGNPKDFASFVKMAKDKSANASEAEKLLIDLSETYLTNDLEGRLSIAESLVEKYPLNFIGRLELANAYQASNRIEDSREQLLQAVKDNPEKVRPLMSLSNSFIFENPKDLQKAEEYAKKGVELLPDMSSTHLMLGATYRAQNKLQEALESYKKAAEVDPKDFAPVSVQGHVNTFLGNYEDARSNYAAAKKLATSDIKVSLIEYSILTYVYDADYDTALKQYEEEISKIDGSESSKMNVDRSGLVSSAMILAFHTGNAEALTSLLETYQGTEMKVAEDVGTEQAKLAIQAGIKNWESRLAILNKDMIGAKALMEEAKTLQESLKNANKMNGYYLGLGLIALAEGDAATAVEQLKKVDDRNIYARYNLAKALELDGKMDEAMEHYKYLSTYNFNGPAYALIRADCIEKAKA